MKQCIRILKFGSSVLRSEADLPQAVHEIYRERRAGHGVVAVVSAFGATTDELLQRAQQLGLPPRPGPLAALLATGETAASALLALALDRSGIPATLLDPVQAKLLTSDDPLDAEPSAIDSVRLLDALRHAVVVLPGFAGRDAAGRTTLFGRGGSDLTAVFLARELGGSCRLYKDVDGLYACDPASPRRSGNARRFSAASWDTVLRLGGGLVQPKALRLAAEAGAPLEITAPGAAQRGRSGTRIGSGPDRLAPPSLPAAPLRVALLGCGTVGGGVLARLAALPELFAVAGVAVRDVGRAERFGVPRDLLVRSAEALVERQADVVVELLGGLEPARSLVVRALELGRSVVTANKALLAEEGRSLARLAERRGASLRVSASVGGALPAVETVRRVAGVSRIQALSGVLNGTCNYVLDQLAAGRPFDAAVSAARDLGFAEADPARDLDGSDTAQKLALLVREAFGSDLDWRRIPRRGIAGLDARDLAAARERGRTLRLVARCERTAAGLRASVEPVEVPVDHPFARARGADNVLRIERVGGEPVEVAGRGAGRWPTTEAVLADLFDLAAERFKEPADAGSERDEVVA